MYNLFFGSFSLLRSIKRRRVYSTYSHHHLSSSKRRSSAVLFRMGNLETKNSPRKEVVTTDETARGSMPIDRVDDEHHTDTGTTVSTQTLNDMMFWECSICMERDRDTSLNCGHIFCSECIQAPNFCPVCDSFILFRTKLYF